MNFDEWLRQRDGKSPVLPVKQKTVADILNSYHGLCYLHVSDVALDGQDRFWLRRSAEFELGPLFGKRTVDWVPVSGFSHGGKVHTDSDVNWGRIQVISEPSPTEWARVYRTRE